MCLALHSVKSINVDFLNQTITSQSSNYPIVLTRMSGVLCRPNPYLKKTKNHIGKSHQGKEQDEGKSGMDGGNNGNYLRLIRGLFPCIKIQINKINK